MELREKRQQLSEMQTEKKRSEQDSSSRLANLNQALLQSKKSCTQLEITNDELKQHTRDLQREIEELKTKCSEFVKKASNPPECKTCQQRAKKDRETDAERAALPNPIRPLPGCSQIDELTTENTKLRQKHDCLLSNFEMVSQKSSQIKVEAREAERMLASLQASFDALQAENEELTKCYAKSRRELESTKYSSSAAQEKQAQLHKDMAALTEQLQTVQRNYGHLEDQTSADSTKLKEQHDTIFNLKMQVSALKSEKSSSEVELLAANSKLESLQNELLKQKQSSTAGQLASSVDSSVLASYQQKLQKTDDDKREVEKQLTDLREEMVTTQEVLAKLRTSKQELKRKSSRLEMQLKEAKQQSLHGSHEVESSKRENETLRQKIIALLDTKEAMESDNVLLKAKLEQLEAQLNDATKSLVKAQRDVKYSKEMTKKLQKEYEAQETQLLETTEQLEAQYEQCSRKERELVSVKKTLETAASTKQALESDVCKLMTRIDELEVANFELDSQFAELKSANSSSYFSRQDSAAKIEDLERKFLAQESVLLEKESQLNEVKLSCALMEKENGRLLFQLDLQSESLAASNAEVDNLNSQLQKYELETREIAAMISDLEDSHLQCQPAREKLEAKVAQLEDELAVTRDKLLYNDGSVAATQAEIGQLKSYNSSLETINNDIQKKLQSALSNIEDLKISLEEKDRQIYRVESRLKSMAISMKAKEEELHQTKMISLEIERKANENVDRLELKLQSSQECYEYLKTDRKKDASQVMHLDQELEELKEVNDCLKLEKVSLERQCDDDKMKLEELRLQIDELKFQLKDSQLEVMFHQERSQDIDSRNSALRKSHTRLLAEVEHLKDQALDMLSDSAIKVPSAPRKALYGMTNNPSSATSDDQENIHPGPL